VALVVTDASEGITDLDLNVARHRARERLRRGRPAEQVGSLREATRAERKQLRETVARRLQFAADVPVTAVSAQSGSRVVRRSGRSHAGSRRPDAGASRPRH
jgi:predicted GTPase